MASNEVFEQLRRNALAEYNKEYNTNAKWYDEGFKSYFIGILSVIVSDKAIKNSWTFNVGGRK